MTYTINQITDILGIATPSHQDNIISTLLIDSRSLSIPSETLFFALRTSTGDGHRYIKWLYDRGVRNFVVDSIPEDMSLVTDANMLVVKDVRCALQTIARYHRSKFNIPVIGITGSRGKTTVKEWLYRLLQEDYAIARSPRSYNSQIGVPLSIWEIDLDTEIAIVEAGISQPGEMAALQQMISPTIGIITNIGTEHDDGFSTIATKVEEKLKLMKDCETIIYCADDPVINDAIIRLNLSGRRLSWSENNPEAELFISDIQRRDDATVISYEYGKINGKFDLPLTADIDIQNAIHALAIMLHLGVSADVIAQRMKQLTPVGTRLDVIEGVNKCVIINDSYTSDLHSLAPALDFMARHDNASLSKTIILSDLMHESAHPEDIYKSVARLLNSRGIERLIGIGNEISQHRELFGNKAIFFNSTADFISNLGPDDFDSQLILIKGAPAFNFGMITEMLEARRHETVLEVNLDNLVHNYNFYRAKLKPSTGIVCMVKASGYGAGSYELAKTLQAQGAAYLAVAVLDEGVDLRNAGITMPIMVLNPKVDNYLALFNHRLEPEIYNFTMLQRIISEATRYGITNYPVHIKLDTGMHRLGFIESEIPALLSMLTAQNAVMPRSIFSHLCAADDPTQDEYTRIQLDTFDRCCNLLQTGYDTHIMRHILNSTGITRFPEHQCDLVRLGICLYGVPTMHDGSQDGLQLVSALKSVIISIREWPAGTTIGYNRRGVLSRDSRIATIPVGYADGFSRHLGNGNTTMLVNGHRCPTVGNICMDLCMIDVTDVDCHEGDSVEIFGPNMHPEEIANILRTIPYEVLTSVSTRVKRIYYQQ
ncbi:MAG: bifunctional UDP-N-acetylmuramoyl-tripeptide:D-alanyl-D-alanine ligase/alanine racemase [Muribaculaceae bacterium]|nr:bifunctional UDP-N-acetylmuramoyl-tripeptide:D-alanyl-D-alanine ligase/alanine racemase [Muribaculaceae bacterium]